MKHPVFLLLCVSLSFLHCARKSKDNIVVLPDGKKLVLAYEETLTARLTSEPPSLDWIKATDTDSAWVTENLMVGLVRFDLSDPELSIQPELATNWTPEKNGRVWTLALRKGVLWSDGVEFKAQQVVDAWQRLLDPQLAMQYASYLFPLKNAREYNAGKIKDFSQVGVRALSDYLIQVELNKPMSFFPLLLAHHSTFPVRKDLIDKYKDKWTEAENLVTLGPFKLRYWKHDSELLLERNDHFYGRKAKLRYVLFYMIDKPSTALRLFERGRLDFIRRLPTTEIAKLKERPEYHAMPGLRLYYYGFKVKKKPFNKRKVRQAIAQAINKQEIVDILGGGQVPMRGWFPKGIFGFSPDIGVEFNVKQARELLSQAGFPGGKGFPSIIIGFNTDEKHQRVAENIQAQLKKNLGVTVELKNEEWKTYLSNLKTDSDYSVYRLGWVADYPDPHNFTEVLMSYSTNNRMGWGSSEIDKLFEQARMELNKEKRKRLYRRAEKILMEQEVPAIPLFVDVNTTMLNSRVENFPYNPMDKYPFKDVGLKQ